MPVDQYLERNRQRLSYNKEITSPSTPEENPHIFFPKQENVLVNCSSGSERSRQIQPSTHVPPSYLPNGEATEELSADDYDDNEEHADGENDEVPALPSVRLLTNKFQTIEIVKQIPSEKNVRKEKKVLSPPMTISSSLNKPLRFDLSVT